MFETGRTSDNNYEYFKAWKRNKTEHTTNVLKTENLIWINKIIAEVKTTVKKNKKYVV